ncbi:MAG: hypothetical protein ACJA16_004695 [Akkermansiaceae bacterium]|jgi:hypothetical protein
MLSKCHELISVFHELRPFVETPPIRELGR